MNGEDFEARLRRGEWFGRLAVPPGMWTVVRVDGRAFGELAPEQLSVPYDERRRDVLVGTSRALFVALDGVYAFTHDHEISVLLPADDDPAVAAGPGQGPDGEHPGGHRAEWLASRAASVVAAGLALATGVVAPCDARVWIGAAVDDVLDYFTWRQADAARSALAAWCSWTLQEAGYEPRAAAGLLAGMGAVEQNELLHRYGVRFDEVPLWQRRGIGLYQRPPVTGGIGEERLNGSAPGGRRRSADGRVHEELELTSRDEYRGFVLSVITGQVADTPSGALR